MEELPTAPTQVETTVTPMSLTEKITNIFSAPGELFDNVRDTPPAVSNWVVPLLMFVVVAFAMSQLALHNPSLADQYKTEIHQKMEKQFQESVQKGKMTQEQADQAKEQAEAFSNPSSPIFVAIQGVALLIITPIVLFVIALLYWLLGKSVIKAQAPYMKVVEVVGLTFFIGILESIVTTIMLIGLDNIHASPSLALAVLGSFSADNKLHLALSKINVFTIWDLVVVSIGLGHLFRRDVPKVMALVFALWILWVVFTLLTGFNFGS